MMLRYFFLSLFMALMLFILVGCGSSDDPYPFEDIQQNQPDIMIPTWDTEEPPLDSLINNDTYFPDSLLPEDAQEGPDADTIEPPPIMLPAVYPEGKVLSPITPYIKEQLQEIRSLGMSLNDNVFMKAGAFMTTDPGFMRCFATSSPLDDDDLEKTVQFFRTGDAQGVTPFERESDAALSGRTASWAITGNPSPLEMEIDAILPRFSVVMFGSNDIGWYPNQEAEMFRWYGESMMILTDSLIDQGIIPILSSISRRMDDPIVDLWVPTLNAVVRAIAQTRQIPFIDIHLAVEDLPSHGLSSELLHLNASPNGGCDFSESGLKYGQNTRNLLTLKMLSHLHHTLLLGKEPPDRGGRLLLGEGTVSSPLQIDSIPFADSRNTSHSPSREFDSYPCGTGQNESGPEVIYQLELLQTERLRMLVLDVGSVDIDIYLLDHTGKPAGCLDRNDTMIQGTLAPGLYHIVLDTFVSGGMEHSGEYLFVIQRCEATDTSCNASL